MTGLTITILLVVAGALLLILGSDWLVDGASDISRRSGMSEFVIGVTIVGIGTSMPEMVVSFLSAIKGSSDMAVGNIIGSNIFNTCLILGITALILPIAITKDNIKRDIPMNIGVTVLLILLGMKGSIFGVGCNSLTRIDGAIFLALFAAYLYYSFKNGKGTEQEDDAPQKQTSLAKSILLVVAGIAGLVFGGRLFVNNAADLARELGWSEKFIGITILAGGTSMPELVTCIVAAIKKRGALALGNILGSNISNILLILGGSALIRPLSFENIATVDLGFVLLASLFLLSSYYTFTSHKLDRTEGAGLLCMEGIYMYLLISAL